MVLSLIGQRPHQPGCVDHGLLVEILYVPPQDAGGLVALGCAVVRRWARLLRRRRGLILRVEGADPRRCGRAVAAWAGRRADDVGVVRDIDVCCLQCT